MTFEFDRSIPRFSRDYRQDDPEYGTVTIDEDVFRVVHDPFWRKFASGWEPDTERVYRQLIKPGSTVLDIGAWIGPTVLLALACGAQRIIALEPNPGSHAALGSLLKLNPEIASRVELHEYAVSDQMGRVSMGMAKGETDTSTSGLGGSEFTATAITLERFMKDHPPGRASLVKIDIEGSEALLAGDLALLADQPVHLSIHVPLFPERADIHTLLGTLSRFDAFDDRGKYLQTGELSARITTHTSHPPWGSRHGNYFEVLLVPR